MTFVRSRGSTHFYTDFPTLFALHFVPSHAALAYCSFRFLVLAVWPLSAIGAPGVLTLVGLFGVGACSRLCWASLVCLLLWPVCAFGRLGRLAVSLFLVKGSARDLVSNDSVGPCWLKNCSAFKFGISSNLDIDLTCEVCKQKPTQLGTQLPLRTSATPHILWAW